MKTSQIAVATVRNHHCASIHVCVTVCLCVLVDKFIISVFSIVVWCGLRPGISSRPFASPAVQPSDLSLVLLRSWHTIGRPSPPAAGFACFSPAGNKKTIGLGVIIPVRKVENKATKLEMTSRSMTMYDLVILIRFHGGKFLHIWCNRYHSCWQSPSLLAKPSLLIVHLGSYFG